MEVGIEPDSMQPEGEMSGEKEAPGSYKMKNRTRETMTHPNWAAQTWFRDDTKSSSCAFHSQAFSDALSAMRRWASSRAASWCCRSRLNDPRLTEGRWVDRERPAFASSDGHRIT